MDNNLLRHTFMKNGTEIAYYTSPTIEGGVNLVLLHSGEVDHRSFDKLIHEIKGDYNILTLDMRGHGKSTNLDDITFDLLVEDVVDIVTYAGFEKAMYLGQALGGSIAQEILYRHPEMVEGLGLIGCIPIFEKLNPVEGLSYGIMSFVTNRYSYDKIRKNLSFAGSVTVGGREYIHRCITKIDRDDLMASAKASVNCLRNDKNFVSQVKGFVAVGMNEALSNNKRVWKLYKQYFPQLDVYKISNVSSMIQYDSPKSIWELLDRMRMKIYAPEEYENAMKAYRDKMDREIEKLKKRQEKQAEEEQRRKEEEKQRKKEKGLFGRKK